MKKDFLKDMEKDISSLEKKIDDISFYNFKMRVMRSFFKTGLGINYAFPFILSFLILFNGANMVDTTPFVCDKVCKELDFDSFSNYEFITEFDDNMFLHSTSWDLNESGFYEREVTYYKYNDMELSDIFSYSFYEFDSLFEVVSTSRVVKGKLDDCDEIFNEETVILLKGNSLTAVSTESDFSNFATTGLFLFFSYVMGWGFKDIGDKLFGTYIIDKLKEREEKFRPLSSREINELKILLELKKENYDMFFFSDNIKGYTLKR